MPVVQLTTQVAELAGTDTDAVVEESRCLLTCRLVTSELPDDAQRWTAAERELALQVLDGRTVVVNVRRGGPHRHLVPWLVDRDMISYVGHAGSRHSWPQSDFANPFVTQARTDRKAMVRRYREWLDGQPELLVRIRAGELTGRALGCWCAPQPCHADVLVERSVS